MIRKFANVQVLDAWRVPAGNSARALRKAAHRVSFAYTPRPGYLYVRARAISSRTNDNWDTFPAEEIEKGYRTFLGKPCFINHHNANHRRARGVIVAAAMHHDRNPDGSPDVWTELLHEIDAQRFPKLAQAILAGRVNRTSMGVDCEYSTCSACGNRATSPAEYCVHMPSKKGMKFRKRGSDGRLREGIIHEICAGLTFFENSFLVEDPADPTAHVLDKPYLHATAARREPPFTPPGLLEHFAGRHDYRLQHQAPDRHSGRPLHHYTGGDPDEPVTIYRAVPHNVSTIHHGDWVTTDADYAHQHARQNYGPDWPVLSADVPARHVYSDENDPHEQGYQGPHLGSGDVSRHHGEGEEQDEPDSRPRGRRRSFWDTDFAGRQHFGTGQPLYHGTRSVLAPGEQLTVGEAERHPNNADIQNDPYVHATTDPAEAHRWGERADSGQASQRARELGRQQRQGPGENEDQAYPPRVYRVHPAGHVEPDLEYADTEKNSWRSADPMRVGEEVHPLYCHAEECGNAEHWPGHPHYQFLKDQEDQEEEDWRERHGMRRQAITGEEAEPGHNIWAEPQPGRSPVSPELEHNMMTREPHSWYRGLSYHGPYHVIRHPQTRQVHVVDQHGRDANPMIGHFGNPERDGSYGEDQAYKLWHGLESSGPDAHRIGTEAEPRFSEVAKERTPAFPHSRIDPQDTERATRPDARVHEPAGHSPEDEWHGPYEVVKHPQTSKFHVIDNQGRHAPGMGSFRGHDTQMRAERSRDYIDRRQQSKDLGKSLADKIFDTGVDVLDPGGTKESRQSEDNTRRGSELMGRYAGGRGQIKFDPDEEGGAPYYEREHTTAGGKGSGWYVKHYGGPRMDVYHRATGDIAHDSIHVGDDQDRLPEHFDDIDLARHLKAWHDQPDGMRRHVEGQHWTHGGDERIQRWKQRRQGSLSAEARGPDYPDPGDHPFFKSVPMSKDNIKAAWYDSTDDERIQGKHWYPDAHSLSKKMANGDAALGAGLLSAYSPRTKWPANMFHASRSIDENRALSHSTGDGPIMDMHTIPAARILAGEHHSQVLNGPKTRAFAHLIEHGGNTAEDEENGTRKVVVDRHAMSVAAGRRLTDKEAVSAPIDSAHYYHHVEQKYLDAADEISVETGKKVTGEHVQATTWMRQVRVNDDEDRAMRSGGGTGRVNKGIKDRARWAEHVRQYHPDWEGTTMHTSALQRTAADPPLRVPPSVDTLRPEACPVCGDQDVFKGQRCPVCGFVAPPDIFRDPDIDQARLNRQELEEGKETSPYPEGPADEEQLAAGQPGAEPGMNPEPMGSGEDAEDQLFHPDQIAPDGVPGVQPDATAPGQGMLEPTGDEEELAEPGELDENGEPIAEQEGEQEIAEANPEGAAVEQDAEAAEDEAMAEQLGEKAEGEEEAAGEDEQAAGGSPGKDQDEEDRRPGGKMTKRTAELSAITAQQRVVDELRRENAALHAGLAFIASLAGVTEELDAVLKQADLANPAQPVDDPPQGPPSQTTEEALASGAPTGSGNGLARGPGHTEDDPSRPGATPGSMTAVPAEATTTALTPGVEIPTAPASNLQDVTAPVQGTNPSQDGGVPIEQRRIETDVRVNPNPLAAQGPGIGGAGTDGTAFPWTIAARQQLSDPQSPEDERGARTFAAIRLAKLRVTAGLVRGDELELATMIERDAALSLHDIEREIGTLGQVTKAAAVAQAQPRYPRTMGPRTASRTAPSFAESPPPAMAMTAGATGYDSDDGDLFD